MMHLFIMFINILSIISLMAGILYWVPTFLLLTGQNCLFRHSLGFDPAISNHLQFCINKEMDSSCSLFPAVSLEKVVTTSSSMINVWLSCHCFLQNLTLKRYQILFIRGKQDSLFRSRETNELSLDSTRQSPVVGVDTNLPSTKLILYLLSENTPLKAVIGVP